MLYMRFVLYKLRHVREMRFIFEVARKRVDL